MYLHICKYMPTNTCSYTHTLTHITISWAGFMLFSIFVKTGSADPTSASRHAPRHAPCHGTHGPWWRSLRCLPRGPQVAMSPSFPETTSPHPQSPLLPGTCMLNSTAGRQVLTKSIWLKTTGSNSGSLMTQLSAVATCLGVSLSLIQKYPEIKRIFS